MGEVAPEAQGLDLIAGLIRSAALVQDILAAASAEHGLTSQQSQLMCVVGEEPSSMMRLGELMRISKSSVTGLVQRAEQSGLVQRAPDPGDGRSTLTMLTEKGRRANAAFRGTVGQRLETIVETLPTEERSSLTAALSRIVVTHHAPQTWPPNGKEHP